MQTIQNYICGSFREPASGRYLDNYNPATGAVYSCLPASTSEDVQLAVAAALEAGPKWQKTSVRERAQILQRIAQLIVQKAPELARAESIDQGKPLWLAKSVDIPRAAANFEFFAGAVLHFESRSTSDDPGFLNYTLRKPVGVAGLISPWNLPLYLLTWKIAPALAMGNTVVCKPSEWTPMTAFLLGEILNEAGLPPGICNIVFGLGSEAGAALVQHPQVPLISFTGSTKTGEQLIRDSAPYYKKLSLELGGKNPNIIFADANLEKAVQTTLRSSFLNQGEICLCGSRIFVEEAIYEAFLDRFVKETIKLKVGDPLEESSFMGALVSAPHQEKVLSFFAIAKEWGASIVTGGRVPDLPAHLEKGYYCAPTIITDVNPDCPLMQEEIFGPVVTVTRFKDEEEVVELANNTHYGLSATLWTENLSRAHRLAAKLDVGMVWVNTWMQRDLRTPFGGVKASGLGREGGVYSLDFYSEEKNVCIAIS